MNTRKIGKITSVDSFRVVVELDEDLRSLVKSGFNDIYEIARINSYIIIPVGSDRIVAIVTHVKIQDETELWKNQLALTLPKAKRYLVATMMGTIQGEQERQSSYLQGVYNYPVLDNPVWYVTKEDLDKIFDTKDTSSEIDFNEDYFLPIGTSPAFKDYKIKINPDKFFGKHAAILGNTGSGKSCTVASIMQSLFQFKFKTKEGKESNLRNAHFIIFDTNGEYKKAFGLDSPPYKEKSIVNSFYIDKDGLKIPYWFMNFDDFDYLFEPSAGTQAPLLKTALGLAKNNTVASEIHFMPKTIVSWIEAILSQCSDIPNFWKMGNRKITDNITLIKTLTIDNFDQSILIDNLTNLNSLIPPKGQYNDPDLQKLEQYSTAIRKEMDKYYDAINKLKINQENNIDLPVYFDFKELLSLHFNHAIEQNEESNAKLREYASTLKLRMQSYFNDDRIASPLLLKNKDKIENALLKFLAFVLGDLYKFVEDKDNDIFSSYYQESKVDNTKTSQVTILDMSLLPYEVLETITGLIGRLILDFSSRISPRGDFPIVIILEEAQNYIPEVNRKEKTSISKRIFERVAREGRKYGVSLVVSSQRPSELSKTVLSQCNSFIIHRLQNPDDQKYVRQLVSSANEDILSQLPILPQQHAIIMGDAVRTPVQVRLNNAAPKPNSDNPKFIEKWLTESSKAIPDYETIVKNWENGGNGVDATPLKGSTEKKC